ELIDTVGAGKIEPELVELLALARSNVEEEGDGRRIWQRRAASARVGPEKVCAHVAVHMLVEPDSEPEVDAYRVEMVDGVERRSGRARMIAATVRVRSLLTEAATPLCFAGLYLGEQHVTGGVRTAPSPEEWAKLVDEL